MPTEPVVEAFEILTALRRLVQDMETPRSRKATEAWDNARDVLKRAGWES